MSRGASSYLEKMSDILATVLFLEKNEGIIA